MHRLDSSKVISDEMVIGLFPLAEAGTTAALNLPSRQSLLTGTGLMVLPPGGDPVEDPALSRIVSHELSTLLGGWFSGDLTPYLSLHDGLVSRELREYYQGGGMTVDWDDPATTLFWIAFEADEWLVQGTGQLEDFFCLSFGHFLTPEQAIGEGGHPRPHPLGPVQPIIARSAPRVLERNQLVDRAADHPRNVFDVYLTGPRVTIKAGVRAESGVERSSSGASHHYAIRIDLLLTKPSAR